ncbi:PREDICTED: uncharacterized protein LOC108760142 [Trachymyrmex cornetzi]|uniref:uncharacterized protein LOC108760142 n=1 Tax=Trachymyrmex cornetzi TaxID=471704 RepID=UPI00084F70C8|nr:PREDICTED: uncharacterized protein LOC108760142 [Trachymyrmex cornetzi]
MKGDLRRQVKVGVNVAKIAIQRLVSDIAKSTGPVDEVRNSNLALEREVLKMRREMDTLRRERTALKDQVETLTRTVQELREREERRGLGQGGTNPPQLDEEIAEEFPTLRTRKGKNQPSVPIESDETSEALLPPVYRPVLRGVQKRIEDRPRVRTSVDNTGRIVMSANEGTREEKRITSRVVRVNETRARDSSLSPAREYPRESEGWTKTKSRRAQKRARRKEREKIDPGKDVQREVAPERAAGPRRDRNPDRTMEAAIRRAPEGGRNGGAIARNMNKVPARPAARDPRFRAHRTAAVLLRCEEAGGNSAPTYADVMRMARNKISLDELEISNTRIRKAQAGGLLIEIPGGEEASAKAEALVGRLKTVIAGSEFEKSVSVIRPVQRAEVRLIDVDQSATVEEIVEAVSKSGKVPATSVRAGPLRQGRGGLCTVWVQCPLAGANLMLSSGKIRVGWTMAKVVPLAKRRLQCFRCLAVGHTRANCLSIVDRSSWCFQCGGSDGHRAFGCRASPRCPVCAARGMNANHRAGSTSCVPYNGRGQTPRSEELNAVGTEKASEGADRGAQASGSRPSQDHIGKISDELDVGLVAVAEPARIPDSDKWFASTGEPPSTAITWQ